MQILALEQNSEPWRFFRKGKLGGTTANAIHPPSRGKYKDDITGTATFWRILAEKICVEKDAEDERERGHRLEPECVAKTVKKYSLKLYPESAVWQSETDEDVYLSPDAFEDSEKPTWACEAKAFDSHKHLEIMYRDKKAKELEDYNPFNSIPKENQGQAVKYFRTNPDLKVLYWSMLNDLIAYDHLAHYTIEIKRENVEEESTILQENERNALIFIKKIMEELINE